MDQAAPDASIAVDERVDRLELCVGDGGLSHGRQVITIDKVDEVRHQRWNMVFRRRDIARIRRVVPATADPVLFRAKPTRHDSLGLIGHQGAVKRLDTHRGEVGPVRGSFDGFFHGQHVRSYGSGAALAGVGVDEGSGQVPLAEFDAFDAAGSDSFGAEEECTDGLEPSDPIFGVEIPDGSLRSGDELGRLETHGRANRSDRVWEESAVREWLTSLSSAHRARITVPAAFDPRHIPSISRYK